MEILQSERVVLRLPANRPHGQNVQLVPMVLQKARSGRAGKLIIGQRILRRKSGEFVAPAASETSGSCPRQPDASLSRGRFP
jgi:hypothetical protein